MYTLKTVHLGGKVSLVPKGLFIYFLVASRIVPILVYLPIVLAVPPDVIEVGGTAHTSHLFSLRPLRFSSLVHPWIGLYICCPQIFHDSFSQGLTLFPSCSERCIQSCLTLCDPWTVPPPGSSVHGILQARILEWNPLNYILPHLKYIL